ncbi:MAG: acyltransferase family protein [Acidimicrobiales bacterium]
MSIAAGDAVATGPGPGGTGAEATTGDAARARPRLAHVPALDGVRALAVIAVLLFHGGYLRGGWLGVDLFFVLSGYLITSLLMSEHRDAGRIHLASFWGRRARRLLPALLAMVALVSLWAWWKASPADLGRVRRDGLATTFFVANWHDVLQGASYWDRGLSPSYFAHAWSLAVEEQMYLVWPLLLGWVLGRRRGRPAEVVARLSLAVAAISAALQLGLAAAGASHERIYLGTDTRLVAVALGAFVAGWRRRQGSGTSSVALRQWAAIAAGLALAVLWWRLDGTSSATYRGGLLLASCLGAVLVAGAADRRSALLQRGLGIAPLRAVGRISYGLYLWHWPLFLVLCAPHRPRRSALLSRRLAATLAVATASWFLLERPILALRPTGWWTGRRGVLHAVAAVLATGCLLAGATSGAQALDTGGMADGVASAKGQPAGAPKVLVLGDSVAASIAKPAIAKPGTYGVAVTRSTVLGCQAVWDGRHRAKGLEGDVSTPAACPPDVGRLVQRVQPDAVLVLYGGWADAGFELDGRWQHPCDPAYDAALRARLDALLREAGSTGAKVVVSSAARSTNTFRQEASWQHTACANRVAKAAAEAAGATWVDLDGWLCPDGRCREQEDGLYLRSDGVHFQGPGGEVASRWLLGQVGEAAGFSLASAGGQTGADRSLRSVCRSFDGLQRVMASFVAKGLGDPEGAAQLREALGRLTPEALDQLPDDVAADLAPVADPAFQARLLSVLGRARAGEAVTIESAGPGTTAALDRAFTRMRQTC